MRWPVILALSLALNLVGWSLFGLWLGDASLHARQPSLELSVVQVTMTPPRRPAPPDLAVTPPPREALSPAAKPHPRQIVRRVPPKPQPRATPEPAPRPPSVPQLTPSSGLVSPTTDPADIAPLAAVEPIPRLVLRHTLVAPSARQAPPQRRTKKGPDLAALRTKIRRAVNRHRHYPRLARRRGIEGKVVLAFRLSKTGAIQHVKVVHSAGRILDNAALAALRRAAPLPYYPDWVRLPVVFQLDD